MRHAVLGAGGVGGLMGGALARAGHPVTLLVRPGRRYYYLEWLTIESNTLGTFEAPVRVAKRVTPNMPRMAFSYLRASCARAVPPARPHHSRVASDPLLRARGSAAW